MFLRNPKFLNKIFNNSELDYHTKLYLIYLHIYLNTLKFNNKLLKQNDFYKVYWAEFISTFWYIRHKGEIKKYIKNSFKSINPKIWLKIEFAIKDKEWRSKKDYFIFKDINFFDLSDENNLTFSIDFIETKMNNHKARLLSFFIAQEINCKQTLTITFSFIEKYLSLNQEKKEAKRRIVRYLDKYINFWIIKSYFYNSKTDSFIIDEQEQYNQKLDTFQIQSKNEKLFINREKGKKGLKDYIDSNLSDKIIEEHSIIKSFEQDVHIEPKLEKDIQEIIESNISQIPSVKKVHSFKQIPWIWIIDSLIEFENNKFTVIEYKFSTDKRVVSQSLSYNYFISKYLNIKLEDVDTIIIQKRFKKTDFRLKTFIKNLYFYEWSFENFKFNLKPVSVTD